MTDALDRRPGLPAADLHERIREAAFALLLTERRAIAPDEIAGATRGGGERAAVRRARRPTSPPLGYGRRAGLRAVRPGTSARRCCDRRPAVPGKHRAPACG